MEPTELIIAAIVADVLIALIGKITEIIKK